MVELIPPPDPHSLLPPLLACLPTAFASRQPPPALLLLLSPILRQRLSLITSISTTTTSDNWLRLLCWDNEKAEKLKDIVERGTYEPHPASGEIEIGDVDTLKYKRFDQDTLRSQIPLPEWGLTAVYLWCADGEGGNGWKLAELLPYEQNPIPDESWSTSITEANSSSRSRIMSEALRNAEAADRKLSVGGDDDYWAMYDHTPSRTPAVKRSPAPNPQVSTFRSRFGSEDYYAQYSNVQPAMDSHDPCEEVEDAGHSSLNGNVLETILSRQNEHNPPSDPPAYEPLESFHKHDYDEKDDEDDDEDDDDDDDDEDADAVIVNQPQPTSPGSMNESDTIDRLEATAERQASSEIGIRQHISTSMKSMFRLAKSAGIDREEFERMVHRELETLSILDRED
jgi:hypothetical protein